MFVCMLAMAGPNGLTFLMEPMVTLGVTKAKKIWNFISKKIWIFFKSISNWKKNRKHLFSFYDLPHNFLKLWLHLPLLHFQGLNRSHWGLLLHLLNIIMFFNIYKKRDPVSWSYNNICIGPWVSHIRLSDFSDQSSTFLFTDLSWTPIFFSSLSDLSNLSYALLIYLEFWVSFGRLSDLRKPRVLLKLKKNFFPEIQGSNQASFFPPDFQGSDQAQKLSFPETQGSDQAQKSSFPETQGSD